MAVGPGCSYFTARLDTTEDAVVGALDSLSAAVADLKARLSAPLVKDRENDVTPRRRHRQGLGCLVVWVDRSRAALATRACPPGCWQCCGWSAGGRDRLGRSGGE